LLKCSTLVAPGVSPRIDGMSRVVVIGRLLTAAFSQAAYLFLKEESVMATARPARASDLHGLLDLFRVSEVSAVAEPFERAEHILSETLARDDLALFVSEAETRIAATCLLITAPNLLRGGRRHGFLENVVTHPDHRGQGHGRAVVRAALENAWTRDCYHVLLQSGRKDPAVHRFYESLGFEPGIRVGYVARRPE
jgi:GNAT superfamily N-acetyltransferase